METKFLKNAVKSLDDILKQPTNEFIRDGVIQRFELTIELAWKTIARYFKEIGRIDLVGPRPVIREAGKIGLISNVEAWLDFLEARNAASHVYSSVEADKVHEKAKEFPNYVKELLKKIEASPK